MTTNKLIESLYNVISDIPVSRCEEESDADVKSRNLIEKTAVKAAFISAGLSIPSGPAGYLTIVPDLTGIWKLQRNMVADIAAIYGKKSILGREQMLYCMFRHSVSQVVRDVVVKTATRVTVEQAISAIVEQILKKIGVHLAQKVSSKFIARSIPVIGTLGAGVYAYFDTKQVGKNAMTLFSAVSD
ncbi:MAG TPA: EcsC family protein [Chitinispirillaceae bacterium]|nr:EcsC family protein [Chitinispirillaceae bacterium]